MASSIHTALLVIDMQNFFATMTQAALPHIQTLVRHFKSKNLPIIFTQHGHDEADLSGPPYRNQLVRKWGPGGSIHFGSEDWELQPPIAKLIKDDLAGDAQIVHKNTYDAFINTDLDKLLRRVKVERVVVCGCMTDCCVDTTARGSFNRGWETVSHLVISITFFSLKKTSLLRMSKWLVRDACGSASKTQHEAGLKGFGFAFGDVLSTNEVINSV
ncbi:Isochorismatase hydrolase [Hypoxylon sp. FL0543]|nr:Isochorismatase hydrolase [Hypoxylon sp. FL0543]